MLAFKQNIEHWIKEAVQQIDAELKGKTNVKSKVPANLHQNLQVQDHRTQDHEGVKEN